jgi:pseudouridine-5'-phosphate glycosidase
VLERLHTLSSGATLRANIALVLANAEVAGALARSLDQ